MDKAGFVFRQNSVGAAGLKLILNFFLTDFIFFCDIFKFRGFVV
jgi:hypothetical protein